MNKKRIISISTCLCALSLLVFYIVQQARTIHLAITEAEMAFPGLDEYVNVVETLHYSALNRQSKELAENLSYKVPFQAEFIKKLHTTEGLLPIENFLYRLSEKINFIDRPLLSYPANSWVYRYMKDVKKLNKDDIPSLLFYTIYHLSQKTEAYSIDELKKVFSYRNMIVIGCEKYMFSDRMLMDGIPLCNYIKATLMEQDWEQWFNENGHWYNYLPRLKDSYAQLAVVKHATLEICNFAPYKTQYILQHAIEDGPVKVNGWYHLDVGECRSFPEAFVETEPEFWVHARHENSSRFERLTREINRTLLEDENPNNDKYILKISSDSHNLFNDARQCVTSDAFSFISIVSDNKKCSKQRPEEITFAKAKPVGDKQDKWFFFIEHPNLTIFNPIKPIDDISAKNDAIERVKNLSNSLNIQEEFEQNWTVNEAPFSIGATVYDHNGSFLPGVMLFNIAAQSIGGVPLPYEEGDTLLTFNGKTIYSSSDLYSLLIYHGYSLSGGYAKPLQVGLLRNGKVELFNVSYFFNPTHPLFNDTSELEAAGWGIADAATFGNGSFAACAGLNILVAAGNLLSGFVEAIDSAVDNREFRNDSLQNIEYVNMKKCEWQATQRNAIAQQKHSDYYINSQWFAFVTPSSVRMLGQNAVRKSVRRNIVKGAVGIAIADGILEGIETVIWSLGTAAPEMTLEARFKDAQKMAPYGIGIGFVSGLIFAQ